MDKATRSEARPPRQLPNQVEAPLTTPLERREIPAQLATTLEHIVGQLDVLTQVINLQNIFDFINNYIII